MDGLDPFPGPVHDATDVIEWPRETALDEVTSIRRGARHSSTRGPLDVYQFANRYMMQRAEAVSILPSSIAAPVRAVRASFAALELTL